VNSTLQVGFLNRVQVTLETALYAMQNTE